MIYIVHICVMYFFCEIWWSTYSSIYNQYEIDKVNRPSQTSIFFLGVQRMGWCQSAEEGVPILGEIAPDTNKKRLFSMSWPDLTRFDQGHWGRSGRWSSQLQMADHQARCSLPWNHAKIDSDILSEVHHQTGQHNSSPKTAWWFGTWMDYDFPSYMGCHPSHWRTHIHHRNFIIPSDEVHHFSEGLQSTTLEHFSRCLLHHQPVINGIYYGKSQFLMRKSTFPKVTISELDTWQGISLATATTAGFRGQGRVGRGQGSVRKSNGAAIAGKRITITIVL